MKRVRRAMRVLMLILAVVIAETSVSAGVTPADSPPRCATYRLDSTQSAIEFELFIGTSSSPLHGHITLGLRDRSVPVPAIAGLVGVSVGETKLVASNFSPDSNALGEPIILTEDPSAFSGGSWNTLTGAVVISLSLSTFDGPLPVPMPILLTGTLDNSGHLSLSGENGMIPDATVRLTIEADEFQCRRETFFSTEVGLTATSSTPTPFYPVSDGDLLSNNRCRVLTNQQLLAAFHFKPVFPDLGLDAVTIAQLGPVLFSTEASYVDVTSISHGDLLSSDGEIVRTNAELIAAYWPIPVATDVGLDAVHFGPFPTAIQNGGIFFSVETDFWSEQLKTMIGHGDILSESGIILIRNAGLVAPFFPLCGPIPCQFDFGLDALYIHPDGEIWFSVETGFPSANFGFISDGDILSSNGSIVSRNLDLLFGPGACNPAEDLGNFGLDALDRSVCVRCHLSCGADLDGDGFVGSSDLAQVLGAWGIICILPCAEDLNGDGIVGSADSAFLLGSWGPCFPD